MKYWVKSVRFKVPFKKGTPEEYDTLELNRTFQPNEVHVETVVLLSKGEISTKKLRVEFPLEEMDMSGFQQGATYEEIQEYVLEKHGLKVNSLYIAQIKRKCGLPVGEHYNISKNEDARVPRCTPEKEAAIMDAFRHFNMIR